MDRNLPILIAEDNQNDAALLEMAIREIGAKNPVMIVPNGAEVLEYLRGNGKYENRSAFPFPSVLFLDLKMPGGVGGFEILRWLREHPDCSIIPVMIFSSSVLESDIKKAYELGANAYFIKPSKFEDLKGMIRSAFEFWSWCAKPPTPPKCGE